MNLLIKSQLLCQLSYRGMLSRALYLQYRRIEH